MIGLININCYALDIPDSVLLNKDQRAPYKGLLLGDKAAQLVITKFDNLDKQIAINLSLQKSLNISQQNEDLLKRESSELKEVNQNLQEVLDKSVNNNFWSKAMWFGIGIITTSAIIYASKR